MKKIVFLILLLCFAIACCSCGEDKKVELTKDNYTDYLNVTISMENLLVNGNYKYFTAVVKTTPKDNYKFNNCYLNLYVSSSGTFTTGSATISNNGNCKLIIDSEGNSIGQVNFYTSNQYSNFPSLNGIKYSFKNISGTVVL